MCHSTPPSCLSKLSPRTKWSLPAGVSGPYHYSERDARCGVDDEERVWPLDSLDLLDKLGTPVWLAIASAHSDSTRYAEQLC